MSSDWSAAAALHLWARLLAVGLVAHVALLLLLHVMRLSCLWPGLSLVVPRLRSALCSCGAHGFWTLARGCPGGGGCGGGTMGSGGVGGSVADGGGLAG